MQTISGMFPHRLKVWRDTGQRDRFGQRVLQVFPTERGVQGMAPTASDIRCRCSVGQGGQRFEERSTLVFVTNHTIYCESNADVQEGDRVQVYEPIHQGILVPDGIIKLIKPIYAQDMIHHLEIMVEVVRAPQPGGIVPAGGEGVSSP